MQSNGEHFLYFVFLTGGSNPKREQQEKNLEGGFFVLCLFDP